MMEVDVLAVGHASLGMVLLSPAQELQCMQRTCSCAFLNPFVPKFCLKVSSGLGSNDTCENNLNRYWICRILITVIMNKYNNDNDKNNNNSNNNTNYNSKDKNGNNNSHDNHNNSYNHNSNNNKDDNNNSNWYWIKCTFHL